MLTTVFIDRDGTIGGDGHYCPITDFVLYENAIEAIKLLKNECKVFALTNQTKISEGEMDYKELKESLFEIGFDDVFICSHQEYENCNCRKPRTGLLEEAEQKYKFQRNEAVIIGDSYKADMNCALNFDILGIHIATGRGFEGQDLFLGDCIEMNNVYEASKWIIKQNQLYIKRMRCSE